MSRSVNKAPSPPPAVTPNSPLNSIVESAFLFTLNPAAAQDRLFLSDLRNDLGSDKGRLDGEIQCTGAVLVSFYNKLRLCKTDQHSMYILS